MITDARTTATTLTEHVEAGSGRLVDEIEWLAREVEAGADHWAGKYLHTDGRLDPTKVARKIRQLAHAVVVPRILTSDEALAPSGVAPLGEAGELGFIVYGHVDQAEALRRARKIACLADLLNGPFHDDGDLEACHTHVVFLAPGEDSVGWWMWTVDPADPHAVAVTEVRW